MRSLFWYYLVEVNKQPEAKSYFTTKNTSNQVTTTAFHKYAAFVVILVQMFSCYYIQCLWVWSLSFAVLQMCVCVECGHTLYAYIKLLRFLLECLYML